MENKKEAQKKNWEPIQLDSVGQIKDVVRAGGGKLSLPFDDPGEDPRKPQGQELDA